MTLFPSRFESSNDPGALFPLVLYDQTPQLTVRERQALSQLFAPSLRSRPIRKQMSAALARLLLPVDQALEHIHARRHERSTVRHLLCAEMHARQRSFWAWTLAEWRETIAPSQA